jgi:hypothetical protein
MDEWNVGLEDFDQIKSDALLFEPIIAIFQDSSIPYHRLAFGGLIKGYNIFALGV